MNKSICPKCGDFRRRQYDKHGDKRGWFCAECQRVKRRNAKLGIYPPKKDFSICLKCGNNRVQKYIDGKRKGWRCQRCDQTYRKLPSTVDRNKKHWQNHYTAHKKKILLSHSKWSKRNPEKAAAHSLVHRAIKDGRLIKQPCEICHSVSVEAHHDDYSQPLSIRWLCKKHHEQQHELNFDN